MRRKIRAIVRDERTAALFASADHPIGTKRLCVDTDYYETFNRGNVTLVDARRAPIQDVTATGIRTTEAEYQVDAIAFATGFDAMTGAPREIDIAGRGGVRLDAAWSLGPSTYLGLMVAGFPNLFIVTGPGSPSVESNMVCSIDRKRCAEALPLGWPSLLVIVLGRVLWRGFADGFEQLRVARLRSLLPQPDHLDLEAPVVAVIEEELHLGAHGGERLRHFGLLDAAGLATALQVGEEFVAHGRVEDMVVQLVEEAEGVIQVEVEGPDDGGSQVVERLLARDLDLAVDPGAKPDADDVGACARHAVILHDPCPARPDAQPLLWAAQCQGMSSSMRACGQPPTSRVSNSQR
jgi:hypothetical protein